MPSIVISEINYHPASDDDNEEFIELHDRSMAPVDLSRWCFANGVELCFPEGVTMAAGEFALVSPSAGQTLAIHGRSTIGTYSGKLSNSGERLTLMSETGATVSSFAYSDSAPWPVTPDGLGPSLEIDDPAHDPANPASWHASRINNGTPGATNSVPGGSALSLGAPSWPDVIQPGDSPAVAVTVDGPISNVVLTYRVMFDPEVVVAMHDDGSNGDGEAGDGVWGVILPPQPAGTMLRITVAATDVEGGVAMRPSPDESIGTYGFVVESPGEGDLPTFSWFIDPDLYDEMLSEHIEDGLQYPAVIAVDGVTLDNVLVNIKGQSSLGSEKHRFKFELPQGHLLGEPYLQVPVDEFALNHWRTPFAGTAGESVAWQAAGVAGHHVLEGSWVEMWSSGQVGSLQPQGLYRLQAQNDKAWRQANGYEEGAFYKEGSDKRTRLHEDHSDIQGFRHALTSLAGEELHDYLLNNVDIPSAINYNAFQVAINNPDYGFTSNQFQYRDTEGSGRWSILPWDLDLAFMPHVPGLSEWNGQVPVTTANERPLEAALYQFEDFRQMFERRLAELVSMLYVDGNPSLVEAWMDDTFGENQAAIDRDIDRWRDAYVRQVAGNESHVSIPGVYSGTVTGLYQQMDAATIGDLYVVTNAMLRVRLAELTGSGALLSPQNDTSHVEIARIENHPSSGREREFVELRNPSDMAIDLSGWHLAGVGEAGGVLLPAGSVLPSGATAVLVADDAAFRALSSSAQLVFDEFEGGLGDGGGLLSLRRRDGSLVTSSAIPAVGGALPVAEDKVVSAPRGVGVQVALTAANAEVPELAFSVIEMPTKGTLECSGTFGEDCVYTAGRGQSGSDSFTYRASDGTEDSDPATVTITITNQAPTAIDQTVAGSAPTTATSITLTGADPNGDAITYAAANPSKGSLDCIGDACTYVAAAGRTGTDSFAFTATDSDGAESTGTVTINLDSTTPGVYLGEVDFLEPESGNASYRTPFIPVTLTRTATAPVTVWYYTVDGTASAAGLTGDYRGWGSPSSPRSVTIPAGQTTTWIQPPVLDDNRVESDEFFSVVIASLTGGPSYVGDGSTRVNILDADSRSVGLPLLHIAGGAQAEGNSGNRVAPFRLATSRQSTTTFTVTCSAVAGTAAADVDYKAASKTFTFGPTVMSGSFDHALLANTVANGDRSFTLSCTTSAGAPVTVVNSVATLTLVDED